MVQLISGRKTIGMDKGILIKSVSDIFSNLVNILLLDLIIQKIQDQNPQYESPIECFQSCFNTNFILSP